MAAGPTTIQGTAGSAVHVCRFRFSRGRSPSYSAGEVQRLLSGRPRQDGRGRCSPIESVSVIYCGGSLCHITVARLRVRRPILGVRAIGGRSAEAVRRSGQMLGRVLRYGGQTMIVVIRRGSPIGVSPCRTSYAGSSALV